MYSLTRFWYTKNILSKCLIPFSWCYRAIISARRFGYSRGFKKTTHFNVPVIVVGNVTVGGTGKTPLVIWLANFLLQQGFKPGIVSRGYGGHAAVYPCRVDLNADPLMVGDEALLLARQSNCPVVIAPDRVAAVQKLLHDNYCDVVISDDGLQHYALGRDIEIVVLDGERRLGNGLSLPAGPLREPAQRLTEVDFVVTNGTAQSNEYAMRLVPGLLHRVAQLTATSAVTQFKDQIIHAVAGIGNPTRFFNLLREQGLQIIEHPFPDHHQFKLEDLNYGTDAIIIMTEKDAVKCTQFATQNYWYLPVQAELDMQFEKKFLDKLKA